MYLRAIRLVQMLKVLRVVRLMRAFRELHPVLGSILGSVRSLLWKLLILCMEFVFAICFVQVVTGSLRSDEGALTDPAHALECWGSRG